jgi:hypothetical protein
MSEQNEMIKKQLEHRTIREFKEESIPSDIFEQLMEVGRRRLLQMECKVVPLSVLPMEHLKKKLLKSVNRNMLPEYLNF